MNRKIVILTEGHTNPHTAKTASSVVRYRPDEVIALLDSTQAGRTCGDLLGVGGNIPVIASLDDALTADTLLIGIAPPGGRIPDHWREIVLDAIRRGMNIVSGLHDFLSDDQQFATAARYNQVTIHDVRKNNESHVARQVGLRDECLRVHTIGTDCSVGKMVTSIEVADGLRQRDIDARFVATGQTGIMVSGDGCPIDRVIADFVSGAAERLVLANQEHDVLLIEGQGSLLHPSYSAVTLGLLHGCVPHGLILCHDVSRTAIAGIEHVAIPSLEKVRAIYETMAALMQPSRVIGVALNTSSLDTDAAKRECARIENELQLPTCDVFRDGQEKLVDAVITLRDSRTK